LASQKNELSVYKTKPRMNVQQTNAFKISNQ